jgi:hypothetical protein
MNAESDWQVAASWQYDQDSVRPKTCNLSPRSLSLLLLHYIRFES